MVSVIKSIGNFDVPALVEGCSRMFLGGYFLVTYFAARSIIFRGAMRMQVAPSCVVIRFDDPLIPSANHRGQSILSKG